MDVSQTLPVELSQPIPRLARAKRSFLFVAFYIALIIIAGVLYPLNIAYRISNDQAELKKHGVAIDAQITQLYIEYGKRNEYYKVTYRYIPTPHNKQDSTPQVNTRQTSKDQYMKLKIGQHVPILYDPARPSLSDLNFHDEIHRSNPYTTMLIAGAIVGIPLGGMLIWLIGKMIMLYLRVKHLVQWGHAAPATIIKTEIIKKGRISTTSITFQFVDENGNTVQGIEKNLPSEGRPGYEKIRKYIDANLGIVTAIYDPKNSSNCMLYTSLYVDCYLE